MKVAVITLGCKVNECESRSLISELKGEGAEVTEEQEYADAYIVNTCSVTGEADRKSRQLVRKCLRLNPNARVYVTGCSSQNDPSPYLTIKNVEYIGGTANKQAIARRIMSDKAWENAQNIAEVPLKFEEVPLPAFQKPRNYVKIQDGCNNFCSYCVIPYLRGRSRSRDLDSIVREAERAALGTREIVLTGIDVSSYGKDNGHTLADVVRALGHIDVRKRLSSFECTVISDDLLIALKDSGFNDHFHLSLQSGCDRVLKAMNRHYDTARFAKAVEDIRRYFPEAGITTDIIAGFPTETETDFKETCDFAEKIGFSDIHVFPYSERKGTRAAQMEQLPMEIRRERAAVLGTIKKRLHRAFLNGLKGKTLSVLFEERKDGYSSGYSTNYARVYSADAAQGEVKDVKVSELFRQGVK